MNNEKLVSIITPMYNAEKYILETILSVQAQTYQNWEMIIVDNLSTDTSREIVKKVNDSRIKLYELNFNSGGPARPRNIGIKNANGEYLAFLDADDLWQSNKLKLSILELDNNADFIYTNYRTIEKYKKEINSYQVNYLYQFLMKNPIGCSTVCCRNFYSIDNIFLFNESKEFIAFEDYYLWLQLFKSGFKFKFINQYLTEYRIHDNNLLGRDKRKILDKKISALKKFKLLFNNIWINTYIYVLIKLFKIKYR